MAVAHDTATRSSTTFDNNSVSFSHAGAAGTRGVAVLIAQEAGATDQISGVTYGGVTVPRVRREVRSTAEAGQVYAYFLGTGVPTGTQTCAITTNPTSGADDWAGVCCTVTAAADTTVNAQAGTTSAAAANPSLAISPTAAAVIYYVIWTGLAAPVTTVEAGGTHLFGNDFGADSAMWSRKAVAAGATSMGYTAASDVFAHIALAIAEVAATVLPQRPLLMINSAVARAATR
jgi:hypothetical protein